MPPNDLLTVAQAATELGLSPRAVQRRILGGSIAADKIGEGRTSAYVIQRTELERYREHRAEASA